MQGWQKLLMRKNGWLLVFLGGLSSCINQYACPCLHPIECHAYTINEETPHQHFCNQGKLIIMKHILWHGTGEKGTA